MEPIRLQKYMSDCGILSRRAAEAEIAAGKVSVNGIPALLGQKIDPDCDEVTYRGNKVERAFSERHYILLNKPRGFVTTLSDEKGRQTVADIVKNLGYRVYPVGRLDMDSDGLLLLTDDGELTNMLTHPRHEIPKYYTVTVSGTPDEAQLARLNQSFLLDGYETLPAKVKLLYAGGKDSQLQIELFEGRNRQIRRMCEEVGLHITKLTRTAVGKLQLGNLPVGGYRLLTPAEVAYLKGEKKA